MTLLTSCTTQTEVYIIKMSHIIFLNVKLDGIFPVELKRCQFSKHLSFELLDPLPNVELILYQKLIFAT